MDRELDWRSLYYGRVHPPEVAEAVKDPVWQKIRLSMKRQPLETKYVILCGYRDAMAERCSSLSGSPGIAAHEQRMVEVRITNYVTALSRGGLIKKEDYR